jgi:hypothetical protein
MLVLMGWSTVGQLGGYTKVPSSRVFMRTSNKKKEVYMMAMA